MIGTGPSPGEPRLGAPRLGAPRFGKPHLGETPLAGPSSGGVATAGVPLVIVAAMGRNRAIGRGNRLPWSMPGDLAHFKALTLGRPMIMGRLTFEAIGRVLPGRESIVVTRGTRRTMPPGVWSVGAADDALALAQTRAKAMGADRIVLAGGATLFLAMMPQVATLHMTLVDLEPEADTFFPPIDPAIWCETSRIVPPRHPQDDAGCSFVDYSRRAAGRTCLEAGSVLKRDLS